MAAAEDTAALLQFLNTLKPNLTEEDARAVLVLLS